MKMNNPKPVGHCKSSAKGKVHSNTGIPQEIRRKMSYKYDYYSSFKKQEILSYATT